MQVQKIYFVTPVGELFEGQSGTSTVQGSFGLYRFKLGQEEVAEANGAFQEGYWPFAGLNQAFLASTHKIGGEDRYIDSQGQDQDMFTSSSSERPPAPSARHQILQLRMVELIQEVRRHLGPIHADCLQNWKAMDALHYPSEVLSKEYSTLLYDAAEALLEAQDSSIEDYETHRQDWGLYFISLDRVREKLTEMEEDQRAWFQDDGLN